MRRRKRLKEGDFIEGDSAVCQLCKEGPDEECFGKYFTDESTGFSVHQYCMFFSSGLAQKGEDHEGFDGFLIKDIKKEISRAKRLRCNFCKKLGATIGCCDARCQQAFHYKCGRERGALFQFFDSFNSYCLHHRPTQRANVKLSVNQTCPICRCKIEWNSKMPISGIPLVTPCCKRTWFHNSCLQKHAQSSGLYYFRCPVCNNTEEFQKEMKRMGIFIPEQDASWEKDDAFADLLFQYGRCDALKCICPNGREHKETAGKWRIRLCDICGQTGTHLKCQHWKKSPGEWYCDSCGNNERHSSTRQRQIGDHSMDYLSRDDDDDDDTCSSTEDCDVNVCTESDDEIPLAAIRNEINRTRETSVFQDSIVTKPREGASPMRKRPRLSLHGTDDKEETSDQKEHHANQTQDSTTCSRLHLSDILASTSSMTNSLFLAFSDAVTVFGRGLLPGQGPSKENVQNDSEPIDIDSDTSSEASVVLLKFETTSDNTHLNRKPIHKQESVSRSEAVHTCSKSNQCHKLPRCASSREVKQEVFVTATKTDTDVAEADSSLVSVKIEGRESPPELNLSVSENKSENCDASDDDSCCITKVVKKSCPFGNDKFGFKCDLDCCNPSVYRHVHQSPTSSKVAPCSCKFKHLQIKTVSNSTCEHVKDNINKPAEKSELSDKATTEADSKGKLSVCSIGTNTLPFKPSATKEHFSKGKTEAASGRKKRLNLRSKKSGRQLTRLYAINDQQIAVSHKC